MDSEMDFGILAPLSIFWTFAPLQIQNQNTIILIRNSAPSRRSSRRLQRRSGTRGRRRQQGRRPWKAGRIGLK